MTPVLIPFPEMKAMADRMAPLIAAEVAPLDWHRFPDSESLITLGGDPAGRTAVVLCSLHDPDTRALPLRFAAATAREMGAASVGLVAPYLGYMRQDRRFAPGQAISAPLFARFLADSFDWLVTADPHLHRIDSLDRLFPIPARRVKTAPLLSQWIAENVECPVLLGPDSESQKRVAEVAAQVGAPYEVLRKRRSGDRSVDVSVPDSTALRTGTPVVLDDIASSGRTMVRAVQRLAQAGTRAPVCVAIHAVFAGDAHADILAAGASRIATTDSIPHDSNAIAIAPILAAAVQDAMTELTFQLLEGLHSSPASKSEGTRP